MAESGNSLFKRIRNAKNSLENAEQSFLDNKSMRGELDLMLAEAELKNLRRKKDVPWSWNRQLLALCGAILLGIAGFGGWMFARGEAGQKDVPGTVQATGTNQALPEKNIGNVSTSNSAAKTNSAEVDIKQSSTKEEHTGNNVSVSSTEMRKLVRSARVELSKSK